MCKSVRLTCGILGAVFIKQQSRQSCYKLAAISVYVHSDLAPFVLGKILAKKSPACHAPVVGRAHRRHPDGELHHLKSASSPVLPPVPKIGRRNGKFHALPSAKLRNSFRGFAERQVRGAEFVGDVDDLLAIAEIGLAGECRAVSNLESRVKEAERLGFKRVIVPYRNIEKRPIDTKMSLIPVKSVYEMLSYLSSNGKSQE